MSISFPESGTEELASKSLIVNNLTEVALWNTARNRNFSTEHSNSLKVKMNTAREYRQSFHVRLKPAPALILNTSTAIADRLEVSPSIGPSAGLYRRVSAGFIATLESEIAAELAESDRRARLQEILDAAKSTPGVGDDDLGNFPTPDLSWY